MKYRKRDYRDRNCNRISRNADNGFVYEIYLCVQSRETKKNAHGMHD